MTEKRQTRSTHPSHPFESTRPRRRRDLTDPRARRLRSVRSDAWIAPAIKELRAGRPIIVRDSENRTGEGGLLLAAQFISADHVNFMAKHARGLVCLALTGPRCDALELPPMARVNELPAGTDFTVSIEAREGVSTGISAHDRARTIAVAVDPSAAAADLVRPGHIFPIRTHAHGVLGRPGQAEAAVELTRLAGLSPAGVICSVLNDDGSAARGRDLERFCATHGLRLVEMDDLISYRRRLEPQLERSGEVSMPTRHGNLRALCYRCRETGAEHIAFVKGDLSVRQGLLIEVHERCLLGDVFGSLRCSCRAELEAAMDRLSQAPAGVLVYLAETRADLLPAAALPGSRARTQSLVDEILDDIGVKVAPWVPLQTTCALAG